MDRTTTIPISIDLACNCELRIKDNIRDYDNYDNTIGVDIVTLQKKTPQLMAVVYTTHDSNLLNEVYLPLGVDGYYEITHLILPNLLWFEEEKKKKYPFRNIDLIYISDGKHIYKVENDNLELVEELYFTTNINLKHSTITKYQKPYFFTCYLWKCYIYLCRQILTSIANKQDIYRFINCGDCLDSIKDLIYKRNFLWATINVLNMLVDKCEYEKALLLLEKVLSCHGFCYGIDGRKINIHRWEDFNKNNSAGIYLDTGCNCK